MTLPKTIFAYKPLKKLSGKLPGKPKKKKEAKK
jgi:hypothetical protein